MKKQSFPLFMLVTILLLLAGVAQASARAEAQGSVMDSKRDQAATSGMREDKAVLQVDYEGEEGQDGAEPTFYTLPDGVDPELRGAPAQIEQRIPLQIQEGRVERSEERVQREEQLRSMSRSERAQARMSDVAKSVQELLANPDRVGGIGQEIRDIAQAQQDQLSGLEADLDDLNSRNGFLKFMVGADRAALNEVKKSAAEIDGRITQLTALEATVTGDEQLELISLIEDLEGQRNDLLETVAAEDERFSMFGWMRRLFGSN
jgi:hypothetical protein